MPIILKGNGEIQEHGWVHAICYGNLNLCKYCLEFTEKNIERDINVCVEAEQMRRMVGEGGLVIFIVFENCFHKNILWDSVTHTV